MRKVGSVVISAPSSHGARAPKSKVSYRLNNYMLRDVQNGRSGLREASGLTVRFRFREILETAMSIVRAKYAEKCVEV